MKKEIIGVLASLIVLLASPVYGQDNTVKFSNCLVDALNGKERKELAKWIFMSISVHPSINEYTKVGEQDKLVTDKYVGALITRLLTESCPSELKVASKENPLAVQKGFELVGQVAMQELMANPETMAALSEYAKYTDQEKISKVLTQ